MMSTVLFHNKERDLYIVINTERINTESLDRELFEWAFNKFADDIDMHNSASVEFFGDDELQIFGDDNIIVFKKIELAKLDRVFI